MKMQEIPKLELFLQKEMTLVLALPVDDSGTIHAATLVYWHKSRPLQFYFVTGGHTEKCRLLTNGASQKASAVVGTIKKTPFTLQMRGKIRIVLKGDYSKEIDAYTDKRGNSHELEKDSNVFLEFTPEWARFTDYSVGWNTQQLDLA